YDYRGVSSFGKTGISGYIYRIFTAYKRFIKPADFINYNGVSANMYPWMTKYLHMLLIVLTAVMFIMLAIRIKDNRAKILQLCIILAASPLFAYFIYVMVEEKDAHGGMGYGEAFMVFIAAYFMERLIGPVTVNTLTRWLYRIALAVILIMGFMFARYANVCYLKADLMQAEAINYYNRLIERIQSVEGYTPGTPIAYINDRQKNDDDFSGNKLFDSIYLPPYQGNSIINDFAWERTMNMWCSFDRVEADGDRLEAFSDEINAMPVYPAEGSVQMFDETIVVKFAD
ncbi:MAG: hypothetical protein IJL90_08270, partial [Lachnospiraceae bacterium]|nr:hypothetical protein [Lachnospiraceae bacterium]